MDLKARIEAVLFVTGRAVDIKEIAEIITQNKNIGKVNIISPEECTKFLYFLWEGDKWAWLTS